MQIITILLAIVSFLTILSGIMVFVGSSKKERPRSAWFFVSTIFATIWSVSIAIFMIASPRWNMNMEWIVNLTFITAVFIDIALLGFINWHQKYGKPLTLIFLIAGVALSTVFLYDHTLMYGSINLANTGNSISMNVTPFYFIYNGFFCLLVPAVLLSLFVKIIKSTSKRLKKSDLTLLIGFMISGTVSLIFNLILPFWTWDYIWLGPLAISTTIIAFYYIVLRYHIINLSSHWLRILSYTVIITSSAVIYMAIFYVIFLAMFRGSTPSTEVIVLNFIMIIIVLALMPAMSELSGFITSLISVKQIDMAYIIKKITKSRNLDIKELAEFLAEHMHFEYIGFIIDGQVYNSLPRYLSGDGVEMIKNMGEPEHGIWQKVNESSATWKEMGLTAVAALRNSDGKVYGQIIFGKPTGKISFSHRDRIEIETVVNLVSTTIENKLHKPVRRK